MAYDNYELWVMDDKLEDGVCLASFDSFEDLELVHHHLYIGHFLGLFPFEVYYNRETNTVAVWEPKCSKFILTQGKRSKRAKAHLSVWENKFRTLQLSPGIVATL